MRYREILEAVIKLGKTRPDEGAPSLNFMNELEATYAENPMNHHQRIIGSAKVEMSPMGNMSVRLHDIQGMGGGAGTAAMKAVCALADKHDVTIKLTACGYLNTPTEVLVNWYEKLGFSVTDEDDGAFDMMRTPN